MKVKILFILMLISFHIHAHDEGEFVKCQGYVERDDQDRTYYELEGKILKVLGRHYMIYGYTPVFKSKRLHKVLKISCVRPDEDFIENVTDIKEEIVEAPEIEAMRDPEINLDNEDISVEKNRKIELSGLEESPPINDNSDENVGQSGKIQKASTPPREGQPNLDCKNLTQKGPLTILKCFIKDGYGSF